MTTGRLCQYRDIFGKPGQGLHAYRIFNIAIVDLLLTVIMAFVLSMFWFSFTIWLLILVIVSIPIHYLFCVNTTLVRLVTGQST